MKKIKKIILMGALIILCLFTFPLNSKADSVSFKTSTSKSQVVVGSTFNVTVTVSSSKALGSWEYTIDYDSSILSLTSGQKSIAAYGNGSLKSQSYTYKFKAIKSGTSKISVKSYNAFDWNENKLTSSISSSSVKAITQSQLQASYSTDNNLKSLSVEGYTLSPSFSSNKTEYTVILNSNITSIKINAAVNDSDASLTGTGTFEVVEGNNKFEIIVTAENGSKKTYTIIANVEDINPITVTTNKDENLTIVKRSSILTIPETYTLTTTLINEQEVPALISEITGYTLVGLKDDEGNIGLYIYSDNNFIKYNEIKLNDLTLYPLELKNNEEFDEYIKTFLSISEIEIEAYKYSENSKFAIILAVDIESGKKNYYTYDLKNNTAILYDSEEIDALKADKQTYFYIIIGLLLETTILFIILILLLSAKKKTNDKKKEKIKKKKEEREKEKKK